MIQYLKGDLMESPARVLVNTVNTQGVMGKGIALAFKKKYPDMFENYKIICGEGKLNIGNLYLYREAAKWIMLFPTKNSWRAPSKIEYLEKGLQKFNDSWDKFKAGSYAFPRLGCGNGGLKWDDVKPLMEYYLRRIPLNFLIYVGNYTDDIMPEHQNPTEISMWMKQEERLSEYEIVIERIKEYLQNNPDVGKYENGNIITRTETYNENEVCEIWNSLKNRGILQESSLSDVKGWEDIMSLFVKTGCASRVFTSEDGVEFTDRPNAFQYKKVS